MSKSIFLKNQEQEFDCIPVAGEDTFNNVFLPLAIEHGLGYIVNMANVAYDFKYSDLLKMIVEFKTFREHVLTHELNLRVEYDKEWLLDRLNSIIDRLELENDNTIINGWVG